MMPRAEPRVTPEPPVQRIHLLATASHGVDYLFTCIEAAIWLARREGQADDRTARFSAEIVRLPLSVGPGPWIRRVFEAILLKLPDNAREALLQRLPATVRQRTAAKPLRGRAPKG